MVLVSLNFYTMVVMVGVKLVNLSALWLQKLKNHVIALMAQQLNCSHLIVALNQWPILHMLYNFNSQLVERKKVSKLYI